jgi:hypothetical protein
VFCIPWVFTVERLGRVVLAGGVTVETLGRVVEATGNGGAVAPFTLTSKQVVYSSPPPFGSLSKIQYHTKE